MVSGSLETTLARFLFRYRITPQSRTGVSPAELLMGRRLRSQFDLLYPNVEARVQRSQERQKFYHDAHAQSREFTPNTPVYARNFGRGQVWLTGKVIEVRGPPSVSIELDDGR